MAASKTTSPPPPRAEGGLPPVCLFAGDVALLVRQAEERVVAEALGGGLASLNLAVHTAESCGPAALEQARVAPMLGTRRVVVIRDLERAPVALLDALLDYVAHPGSSAVVVLTGAKLPEATGGVDRGRRLENAVKKVGEVRRFRAQDQDPVSFALAQARALGHPMDRAAASVLVELCGGDLGRVQSEVEKAAAYAGPEATIDVAAVEAVGSSASETEVWGLTEAIVRKDPDRALRTLNRLLDGGEPTHKLLAMIAWQMRELLDLQDTVARNEAPPSSWQRWPGRLRDARTELSRRPIDRARLLDRLATANREMNRSRAGDRRVFESLVMALCAG